jgi:hypothetical protein
MNLTLRFLLTWLSVSVMLSLIPDLVAHGEEIAVVAMTPRVDVHGDGSFGRPSSRPLSLLHVGPRYGVGGNSPLGEEQQEDFVLYDIAAMFQLPWAWHRSGWTVESRLLTSGGQLTAAGTDGLMGTVVPALALITPGGSISVDFGLGAGFFSNHRFGVQDFGGPAQIVGTTGIGFDLLQGFHAGYRFQHFSDAGMYGPTSLGVDMHIMDVSYRF